MEEPAKMSYALLIVAFQAPERQEILMKEWDMTVNKG